MRVRFSGGRRARAKHAADQARITGEASRIDFVIIRLQMKNQPNVSE